MLLVSVIDCVQAILLAQEPFHLQLQHLNISIQILRQGNQRLNTQLCHLKVLAIAASRYRLHHFLEIL